MTGRTDRSALLRAPGIAAAMLGSAPAWLWDTEKGRILLASAAGIAFFGEPTLEALARREFGAGRPEAAQISRIGRTLPRDGTSRLSLLRFFAGFRDVSMPCQCRIVGERGAGLLLVVAGADGSTDDVAARAAAVLGSLPEPAILRGTAGEIYRNPAAADRADLAAGTALPLVLDDGAFDLVLAGPETGTGAAAGAKSHEAHVPISAGSASGPHDGPDRQAAGVTRAGRDDALAAASDRQSPKAPAARSGRPLPKTRRFTFLLDADSRFVEVGAGFAALVGPRSADVIGRSWHDLNDELGLDVAGRLAPALATHDTWSDVRVLWPTDFGERAELRLSALPRFGEGRGFAGYRGFADVLNVVPHDDGSPEADWVATAEPPEEAEYGSTVTGPGRQPRLDPVVEPTADAQEDGRSAPAATTPGPQDEVDPETDRRVAKIHRIHAGKPVSTRAAAESGGSLNDQERSAFKAIAAALGARWQDDAPDAVVGQATVDDDPGAVGVSIGGSTGDASGDNADGDHGPGASAQAAPHGAPIGPAASDGPNAAMPVSLLKEVLDRVPLGLAIVRDERIVAANRAFLDLFEYLDTDQIESAGGLGALLEGRGNANLGEPTAVAGRRRDGAPVSVEVRLGRTPWVDGPAMLMNVREASPESDRTAEPDLSTGEMRAILDAALDGVIVVNEDAGIVSANDGAERLWGRDRTELEGKSLLDLISEGDRAPAAEMVRNLAASVPTVGERGLDITLLGTDEPAPVTLTMTRLGRRQPARFCAVLRDMSAWNETKADLVAARKRAENASSQKSDFLAKMSHEIRTPLNGIIGFSEIILDERFGPFGNDRYRDYIKDIRESGEHLMSLVNDLLDLSKVEAGKLEMSFTGVKLNDVAEQSVAIMQPQASKSRVIVRTNLWPTLPATVADIRSVRQVLLNLLSNAIKFTPPGGQVIVSTVLGERGDVFVRIRDTGPGMSESDVSVALEPFRQLPVTPTGGERGTGLGLPLAKALVEANRASFSLQSKVGEGTLVEICFPQSRVLAE